MPKQPGVLSREPFRLFFPLAALATSAGVMLWPLFHFQALSYFPGLVHARVMSAGLAGFLLGFLGTAVPRLLSAPSLHRAEIAAVLSLWLASLGLYLANRLSLGDSFLAGALGLAAVSLLVRWTMLATDTPPPGVPVALVALLCGALSMAALAWEGGRWLSALDYRLAHLFLYQGLPLLCLLGIGPYLFPRLFGRESSHSF